MAGRRGHTSSAIRAARMGLVVFRYCHTGVPAYDPGMRRLLLALPVLSVLIASPGAAKQVEVTVEGMHLDPTTGSPVVRLVEKDGKLGRELPIWIGPFEAQAIALEIQGVPPPRPLTHDLMKQLVERLGAKVTRVVITDLRENTYFAALYLDGPGGKGLTVDARPSDAIALALRFRGPIMVDEELFQQAPAQAQAAPAAAHLWGLTVQDLTPDMAALFEVPGERGVLVSDVEAKGAAKEVARGDIITALDGQPVGSVEELTNRAGARS